MLYSTLLSSPAAPRYSQGLCQRSVSSGATDSSSRSEGGQPTTGSAPLDDDGYRLPCGTGTDTGGPATRRRRRERVGEREGERGGK